MCLTPEETAALAARMTRWGTGWVVAVDVPSGVRADTGEVMGAAVKADVTVTFSRGKPGLYVGQGAAHSGRVVIAGIGIPDDVYPEGKDCLAVLVGREDVSLPPRPANAHKGEFGKLFILAGSRGYTGAACLAAGAAVRGGAGLVTLAVPGDVYPIVAAKCCDEVMAQPWPEDDGELVERAKGCTAAVIGPGLGRGNGVAAVVRHLLGEIHLPVVLDADGINAVSAHIDGLDGRRAERLVLRLMKELRCPVILDADGLNIISRHIHVLDEREGPAILTPHDGEFARLSGCGLPIADRLGAARGFAQAHRCVLVLKGCRTVTASWVGPCAVNPTGNPGMAKGGSGDALAGLMGALAAPLLAVWLHGRAGDLAAADKGEYGMTPSDLIEQIPYAMKELV